MWHLLRLWGSVPNNERRPLRTPRVIAKSCCSVKSTRAPNMAAVSLWVAKYRQGLPVLASIPKRGCFSICVGMRGGHCRHPGERIAQHSECANSRTSYFGIFLRKSLWSGRDDKPGTQCSHCSFGATAALNARDCFGIFLQKSLWCGREDSNFHGSYPTATSTLRVYQFRHDRTS